MSKAIGKITHFFDKISVGVFDLTSTLRVGDTVKFIGKDGQEVEQTIESIQVEKEQVKKAGKGQSVGVKLSKIPKVGTSITK
ncbi:MAG: hypothetical protein V1902_01910 [Candidatus Falkowbacteria bacterium]